MRPLRIGMVMLLNMTFAALAMAGGAGFRSKLLLDEHFAKHGREFGAVTEEQYLHLAQQLRDARPGKDVLQVRRPDGGFSKFDRKRGYFGAYDADGGIRTFFVPNDGIRYFERRQAERYGGRP
jgi:filamentous hemagglutinin